MLVYIFYLEENMERLLVLVFFTVGVTFAFASGQQGEMTSVDNFVNYQSWMKVNQTTITGDETGVLGPAHERAKGFREIYINDVGKAVAYGEVDYPYPLGTIIVKESFKAKEGEKGKLNSITIMVKREEGYDLENGNWEYVNANDELEISRQGKIGMCSGCHSAASERDFVFWDSSF